MLSKALFLTSLLARTVFTSPVVTTDLARTNEDIVRRAEGDIYKPDLFSICTSRGFAGASPHGSKCVGTKDFQFTCIGSKDKPPKPPVQQASCKDTHMCLDTERPTRRRPEPGRIAGPNYRGLKDVVCMEWATREEVDIEEDVTSKITPLSQVPPAGLGVGHMYGTLELEGFIYKQHPVLEFDMISEGQSGALGQKTIGDDENRGLSRVYNIEANYEDAAQFAGLVSGLKLHHGQVSLTMHLAYLAKPFPAYKDLPMR